VNPIQDFLIDDETDDEALTAYELYKIEMDAKFQRLDAEELATLHETWRTQGDKFARERIIHALLPMVPSICQKLQAAFGVPRRDQWDDCVQAGNLAILKAVESWQAGAGMKLSVWAYRDARRDIVREVEFLDEGRDWRREHAQDDSDEGDYVAQVESAIDFEAVRQHIGKLTERQQLIVNLLLSGVSVEDAAETLGISRQKAYTLHERAIKALRAMVTGC
jgi:RNA polymerase sigma factor (sigma-70 family)